MSNFKERKQKNMKKLIFDYLTPEENDPIPQKIFNYFYSSLIIINILSVILETESSIYLKYSSIFGLIEQISIIIFFIEYILRIYTADLIPAYQNIKKPYKRRIRYIFSFIALFDLLSFLPFYFIRTDFRFLKMFRLFRFLRIFKIERYSKSINLIGKIFKTRKHEFISAFIIVIFLIVFSSCLIYIAENEAQPDKYSSIPDCFYWSVITLTSVGYGDIYPVTLLGKIFTIFIAILGLSFIILPTSILSSAYSKEISRKEYNDCQNCMYKFKRKIDDD